MPELPDPKARPHPWHGECIILEEAQGAARRAAEHNDYAELHVTSNFTFLTGASHPDEMVAQAAALGYRAIAITDCNSLAGIVRGHVAAQEAGIPFVVGCRLAFQSDAPPSFDEELLTSALSQRERRFSILVYPTSRAAYGRLCQLLTRGKRRTVKGQCHLVLHDLLEFQEGLLGIVVPPVILDQHFLEVLRGLRRVFDDDRLSLAVSRLYQQDDARRLMMLNVLATHVGVPLVATNDVHYHAPHRRPVQDVLTCVRHGCTIDDAGFRLFPNGEQYLKSPEEMTRLFAAYPQAIARTIEIAQRAAAFSLDELRYEYPNEVCPPGRTPMQHLIDLTWQGAAQRFPESIPDRVRTQVLNEFALIEELQFAPYFLTVHDLVTFARSQGILCQGRGAAANSAVCYCLGVTAVNPARIDLLFERFVSRERNEPPDIDIDFEHERREEVIQYIYKKYGRHRAALTAEVISYRGRSAVRDVGKALGLSLDCVDRLAKNLDGWGVKPSLERLRECGVNPHDPTIRRLLWLTNEILGFPRHLSQHVGGFVITRGRVDEIVPVENAAMPDRTVIEWDKDDIDAMGVLKVDVLGLGMLTCISKCFTLIDQAACGIACDRRGEDAVCALRRKRLELHTIPSEDPVVYDMICHADTIGVFQIESRAQMSMLPRLKPRCFYDLVIEVAIVRPGPIQGNMVHPYLRRRNDEEKIEYPNDAVKRVLGKTLGVPLFQEQAMSLAIVAAGFTPGEADALRRAMAAWKRKGDLIYRFGTRLIEGMLARGYPREFAERCFEQIKGFSEYGFPESHAASFALLVYASAWLKCHHPAAFAAALINSQPMGFYAPAQIVRDAREHGVDVRGVDVNHSNWDCTLEDSPSGPALRLGMRLVRGLRVEHAQIIVQTIKNHGPFRSIVPLHRASRAPIVALRRLAAADAFQSMGFDRQTALWHVRALRDERLPMFDDADHQQQREEASLDGECSQERTDLKLPAVSPPRKTIDDYATLGLSLKAHPVSFMRAQLTSRKVIRNGDLKDAERWPQGRWIAVAGVVLVRQRPGTASGIVFMTIEDETGIANLIVRPHIYDRYRRAAKHGVIVIARGRVERQGEVIHVNVSRIEDASGHMRDLLTRSRDFH
jgi:error-prone DNA polymerase